MARRLRQTLMDYMVIGVSPALIMGMVGSLLFFLLTVFYHGQYEARLHFIFAMFTLAIVLIARISMEQGIEYASLFGIALAVVVAMALARFVQIQGVLAGYSLPIHWGLMAIVWWSAHKLTWDCTFIDDAQDASGEGLLQGLGFDPDRVEPQASAVQPGRATSNGAVSGSSTRDTSVGVAAQESGRDWYQRIVQRRRRPHTPGLWVMYYALAALPLFGIGQLVIPAADTASRLYAFRLICVYVACALGLLLTTSFLGLRRYLRQRNLQMPLDMAGVWLGLGAVMILAVLLVCTLLPRPGASLSISQLPFGFGSPGQRRTHDQAVGNDGPEQPEQATRTSPNSQQQPAASAPPADQKQGDSPDRRSSHPSESASSGQSSSASDTKSAPSQRSSDAPAQPPNPSDEGAGKSPSQQSVDQQGPPAPQDNPSSSDSSSRDKRVQEPPSSSEGPPNSDGQPSGQTPDSQQPPDKSSPSSESSRPLRSWSPTRLLETVASGIGNLLKLVFLAVLVCAAAFFAWKYRAYIQQMLAQMWRDLQRMLAGLWGGHRAAVHDDADSSTQPSGPPPPSFASYADPFLSGTAERYTTEQLIRYSFEALEAWGREAGCARDAGQTPLEFGRQIASRHVEVGAETQMLADLYCRVAYGRERISSQRRDNLRRFWQQLRSASAH